MEAQSVPECRDLAILMLMLMLLLMIMMMMLPMMVLVLVLALISALTLASIPMVAAIAVARDSNAPTNASFVVLL